MGSVFGEALLWRCIVLSFIVLSNTIMYTIVLAWPTYLAYESSTSKVGAHGLFVGITTLRAFVGWRVRIVNKPTFILMICSAVVICGQTQEQVFIQEVCNDATTFLVAVTTLLFLI